MASGCLWFVLDLVGTSLFEWSLSRLLLAAAFYTFRASFSARLPWLLFVTTVGKEEVSRPGVLE